MDAANRDAARQGDRTSERAGQTTTGTINRIEPQPREIPRGLGLSIGTIALWATVVAVLIFAIWHATQSS